MLRVDGQRHSDGTSAPLHDECPKIARFSIPLRGDAGNSEQPNKASTPYMLGKDARSKRLCRGPSHRCRVTLTASALVAPLDADDTRRGRGRSSGFNGLHPEFDSAVPDATTLRELFEIRKHLIERFWRREHCWPLHSGSSSKSAGARGCGSANSSISDRSSRKGCSWHPGSRVTYFR
jgi:hypothetical protein